MEHSGANIIMTPRMDGQIASLTRSATRLLDTCPIYSHIGTFRPKLAQLAIIIVDDRDVHTRFRQFSLLYSLGNIHISSYALSHACHEFRGKEPASLAFRAIYNH